MYVVYVCSSIYLHRMSPNTACNCLLHMNLSIVQLLCLYMHVFLSISLCRYCVLVFFLHIYIIIYIYICIYIYINIYVYTYVFYICLYLHIISLYLSATFLAHVLRPNSFHRCSSCTSHCRSCTSLPEKRFRWHARAFYFPACFQVPLTYFHIHVTFSFRSPPPGPQVLAYVGNQGPWNN